MPAPLLIETIQQLVAQALEAARQEGVLQLETIPEIQVERPGNFEHGDFATNLPLRLARATRIDPLELAQSLASHIATGDVIDRVEAARPGFINFYLKESWLRQQVEAVRQAGDKFGNVDSGHGRKMMVEFVSVNPTGPVHVGHTRGAVLGSALANVLEAAGYDVTREYYVNDAGSQMQLFYRSVLAAYKDFLGRESDMPENGYKGEYIVDLAKEIIEAEGQRFLEQDVEQALIEIGDIARGKMVSSIKDDLSGEPPYFASDIAYHYNKFIQRGFESVVDIWGADHQGHVPRMKSAVEALGVERDRLTVLIAQMVSLRSEGEVLRVSKRTGNLITLKELAEEVGADACRYFFLARTPSTQMEFDLELAKKESSENPVYYVQYAHARNASILNLARERNIDWSNGDVSLLTHPSELELIRVMLQLPELVDEMAKSLEPHHLPHYATELANSFHTFYENCRVVSSHEEDGPMNAARLKLVESAQIVFRRSLELMGMSAPDRM